MFRYHECQNPSIISEDIGRAKMVQQFWRRRNGGGTEELRRNRGTEEERRNRGTEEEYSCLR